MSDSQYSGVSTISGGVYEGIKVEGLCKVKGDLEFTDLEVSGVLRIQGFCKGETIDISGVIRVLGNVECNTMKVNGSFTGKDIKAEEMTGSIGRTKIGSIFADVVSLKTRTRNEIKGIYGESVSVIEKRKSMLGKKTAVEEIIADEVKLKGIKVKRIEAKNVELENCSVEELVYSGTLINKESFIKTEQKN